MIGFDIALVLIGLAVLAASWRIVRGPADADRVLGADLVVFSFVGLTALLGVRAGVEATFDLVLLTALVGVLAALSMARLMIRGKR